MHRAWDLKMKGAALTELAASTLRDQRARKPWQLIYILVGCRHDSATRQEFRAVQHCKEG